MLSPVLLERLRLWWRVARAQGSMLDGGWLFPGMNPVDPLSTRQLNRAVHAAAEAAQIDKRVTPHTLRHNSARRIIPSTSYRWPDSMANLAVGGVCDSA
jgi:integrase